MIIQVCEKYPEFKEMYERVYDICRNIEEALQRIKELENGKQPEDILV